MAALEMAIERLRPLVNTTTAWEFCIVWTIGDDPSRFILWKGCCCCGSGGGGGRGRYSKKKEEKGKEQLFLPRCRDDGIQHPMRTEACKELAKFPLFIPLYSGIHGEVIMSMQARWHSSNSSYASDKTIGTHVLVPVPGGLVELCTRKQVPRDENILNFIRAQCVSDEQVFMASHTLSGFTSEHLYDSFYDPLNIIPSGTMHELNVGSRPNLIPDISNHLSYDGSSTVSDPSDIQPQLGLGTGSGHVSCDVSQEKSSGTCPGNNTSSMNSKRKQEGDDLDSTAVGIDDPEAKGKKGTGCSKNLLTERKRRKKNKELLYTLRSTVPNITKMHTAATLGDAVGYIKELQTSIQKYEEELTRETDDESTTHNVEEGSSNLLGDHKEDANKPAMQINDNKKHSMPDEKLLNKNMLDEKKAIKAEIEVHEIGTGEFLIKIICSKRKGAFLQLMKAMDMPGLQIVDVNVTTCNALVLNTMRVEAKRKINPETLKAALIKCMQ